MAKRLTPEEKAQRELDKVAAREAARLAKAEARRLQWDAERQAARQAFEASLTEEDKLAIATILKSIGQEQDPNKPTGEMRDVYESDFIASLTQQLKSWGRLSPAQLAPVVKAYRNKIEFEAQKASWPDIASGDDVMVLCKVYEIKPVQGGYGWTNKIKLKSHYGRIFQINTTAAKFLDVARASQRDGLPINVQGKAGWVSPDSKIVVLGKKGLYFQGL